MANPLLSPSALEFQLPDYAAITDADFREAIEVGMDEQIAELEVIATDESPATVANVLEAWERTGATLTRAMYAFWVAKAADTNDERDAIMRDLAPKLAEHTDRINLDRRLYQRLVALDARVEEAEIVLDEQDAHLLEERLKEYRRGGVHLEGEAQERFKQINTELATLSAQFEELVVAGRNASSVHVTDRERLAGLSEDEVAGAAEDAKAAGLEGWLLTLTNTTQQPLMTSLDDRELRRELFQLSINRGLGGAHPTGDLIIQIAKLRAERAELLGYPHHGAYVAEDGCAGSTEVIGEILTRLGRASHANARTEADELAARFAELVPGETFEAWDWAWTAEIVRQERFQLGDSQLRPYLEFENVLTKGVFAAATALYGITFVHRPELRGYTEASRVYEVREEDGSPLGAVVIDPYTRPTKQGGAWMTSLVDQSTLLDDRPLVTNTCNFPEPAPGSPSLLSWDNVITLFHEFGHDLHGLLSDVRHPSRTGTEVPRDFVEFPSQVNEIWAWQPELLAQYAVHHETGEPMPAEWIETLLAARSFGRGFEYGETTAAMILDQAWHTLPVDQLPADASGVEEFEARVLAEAGVDVVPPRYRSTYFSHIWGSGYAAAYYSYLWSEIMDADTVAWFGENGMLNREAGERFRRTLLGRGGSIEVMAAYRDFRGSDPDVKHLEARVGA
ncbi:M3 family metallopeptidase [Aestuariimicrobium ganziense]|uniref:M3 family metallopeptidase n=1 Tax=Aestuariimicrobium ganziense TaxID=2773677 RepID=UPI001940C4F0|nr:M3 family metallopeptidase [Aestuariimicrobium ganziense]